MAKLSVCAECFFTNLPFEKRIEKIAAIGYKYIEFWHPEGTFDGKGVDFSKAKNAKSLKKTAKDNGIIINDFAFSAWDGSIGGNATNDKDHTKYLDQIQKMLDFANEIGCKKGIILSGMTQKNLSKEKMIANLTKAYTKAVKMAEKAKITLVLEPLNTLVDHAGFFLDGTEESVKIVRKINSPNLKLLYDVYHMQIMQGNIIDFLSKNIDIVGHFHSAGVPGRAELFDTEVNYPAIIKTIDKLGYKGCFGLEYFPKLDHAKSLKQTLKYLG
jgi:hydroxypyruvate isomerase